jgi:hypothetical protein
MAACSVRAIPCTPGSSGQDLERALIRQWDLVDLLHIDAILDCG